MSELVLEGIRKRFGDVLALAGVDLRLAPGELFTLLGPSGCGKTTLLRTVAGFERPDAGRILLGGRALEQVPTHQRGLGLVFQSYALFPHLSVFENVAFPLRERGQRGEALARAVAGMLELVRLDGLGDRFPEQLSGGQQQRVGIARALAMQPRLLLMDEPLSNLDAQLRVAMRGELRQLQRSRGLTTLYVTHDQEEALAISDRVAVLNEGRVLQVGTPWEVYRQPASTFVAGFVGRMNLLPWEALPGGLPGLPPGCAGQQLGVRPEDLEVRLPGGGTAALRAEVREASFVGSLLSYRLSGPAGLELQAEVHRPDLAAALTPGTAVELRPDPDRLLLFDRDGSRVWPA